MHQSLNVYPAVVDLAVTEQMIKNWKQSLPALMVTGKRKNGNEENIIVI